MGIAKYIAGIAAAGLIGTSLFGLIESARANYFNRTKQYNEAVQAENNVYKSKILDLGLLGLMWGSIASITISQIRSSRNQPQRAPPRELEQTE